MGYRSDMSALLMWRVELPPRITCFPTAAAAAGGTAADPFTAGTGASPAKGPAFTCPLPPTNRFACPASSESEVGGVQLTCVFSGDCGLLLTVATPAIQGKSRLRWLSPSPPAMPHLCDSHVSHNCCRFERDVGLGTVLRSVTLPTELGPTALLRLAHKRAIHPLRASLPDRRPRRLLSLCAGPRPLSGRAAFG